MISFSCNSCNHVYKVLNKYAGKKAKCKKCNSIILIPSESSISVKPLTNRESEVENISRNLSKPAVNGIDSVTNTEQIGNHIGFCADISEDYKEIIDEIEKLNKPSRSWQKNMFILLVTLFVFFKLGLLSTGINYIIALVLVLLVHEMGHLIGMYIFGYRNVKMFFIPFFGAAVSGESRNVDSYKKAIVTLLGPGPGLFLGIILLLVYAKTNINFLLLLSTLFIVINIFNLLPFFPLDGGRFLHEILFSRNRYLELVFKIFASLALIISGLLMKFWLLAIIGLFNLLTIQFSFKLAGISNKLKKSGLAESDPEHGESEAGRNYLYKEIIDRIKGSLSGKLKAKTVARFTHDVFERVYCRPPKIVPTVGLSGLYLFFCFMPLVLLFTTVRSGIFTTKEIVEYQNTDGHTIYSEQTYVFGRLSHRIELSEDRQLYHGKGVSYNLNSVISKEANWFNGRWHRETKFYDQEGNLTCVTVFDKGKFVSRKELKDGRWIEQSWDDLPFLLREVINKHNEKPPHGPRL